MDIEKNIPLPKPKAGRGSGGEQTSWDTFERMSVGDSILVDGGNASSNKCPAYNSARAYGYQHGKRFSGRKAGEGKVRIWRVE